MFKANHDHSHNPGLRGVAAAVMLVSLTIVTTCVSAGHDVASEMATPLSLSDVGPEKLVSLPVEGDMPSLEGATGWLNSSPLMARSLKGKTVLIEFWTYTCINWRRQLPYVRAWADKYRSKGLVVIGVHTPEFDFEKNLGNIREALKEIGIDYPVLIDSDYAVWQAFGNHYWPALYLVDARGRIRYHKFGEGQYEQSELAIKTLLAESGVSGIDQGYVSVNPQGAEAGADWNDLRSNENYVGSERTENFDSPAHPTKSHTYEAAPTHELNHWTLAGDWTIKPERIVLNKADGKVVYRFHARDLHLVMGPAKPGSHVRYRILVDGRPPGNAHGVDADDQGEGTITVPRMYQLIRQQGPIQDRQFQIEFQDAGVEVYSFTFG